MSWTRKEGEQVAAGETICEVETDKAVFDVEAPAAGTILKIFCAEGEDVPVLSRLAVIGEPGEDISTLEPVSERAEQTSGPAQGKAGGQERTAAEPPNRSSKRAASPSARRLAAEENLCFEEIAGSGPGGRISEQDVLAYLSRELAVSCQEGSIGADQLSGGTFTISNLGSLGVERFSPILNPPEVGVLGVGAIGFRHVQGENGILFQRSICLSLTVNHQVVDGAPAARFLSALGEAIGGFALPPPLPWMCRRPPG